MGHNLSKVSVIIPTHNRGVLVQRAIQSVLNQSYTEYEILIIDDHSTESLKPFLAGYPVQYLISRGRGVSAARNTGIRVAKGEYIAFLDSDDEWLPHKLEKQVHFLDHSPSLSIVHCNEQWRRHSTPVRQLPKHKKFGGRIFDKCTEQCLISPSCTMMRAALFTQQGFFDESFPTCEDFDLWLRISSQEEIGFLPDELVIKHGGHDDQLSLKYHSMDLWRLRALIKHIHSPHITSQEKAALQKSIQHKSSIYLKGLDKRKSNEFREEVEHYLASSDSE